jgi:heavy metal sensor kinase
MTPVSIRLRLTAWYAGVLLVSLLLFGFGMWFALYQRLVAGIDTRLDQRVQGLKITLTGENEIKDRQHLWREIREFGEGFADGTVIQLRDSTGGLLPATPDQIVFPRSASPHKTVDIGGRRFRTTASPLACGGETFELLLASPLDEVLAVTRVFRYLLLGLIPAVLVLASLGGYWLSRRALRPVDQITAAARSISVQNLSQRISVPRTGDELQRMSETWNEVLERLEGSVKRIRQFTADASHELRTPIALIRATAELALRRERAPEEYRNSLRSIESEAEQMTALTESLLVMARADSNGFQMTLAPTDLNTIVTHVIGQHQALADEKGIRLKTESSGLPALAHADGPAIHRLLLILLDNALKHTPSGGTVTVAAHKSDGSVLLSVADTGEGIAPDDLPHIFERFYRSDPARAGGSGSGFGLGLSIAQAIAQAHGTRIRVESPPGAGALFTVWLKVA